MMDISVPYYEDLSRISNSNIGWFLQKGPAFLHKMLTDPPPEEKNPVLERGTMIHEYLLQPEEFQKDYVIWDKSRPSSAQQEKFCQAYASSLEIEPNKAILEAYKAAYRTKGKTEETMLSEGSKIASTLKDYIDYLKSGDQRIMIGPYDYQMLKKIRNNIEAHKLAKVLLWPGKEDGCLYSKLPYPDGSPGGIIGRWFHEFHINWDYDGKIKCKSLLDSLTLNFRDKKVTIMDLKTTAKLWHFEESIEMYDYLRQLDYYSMAVRWYLVSECGVTEDEIFEWQFEYYIIGIDTTGSNEIRVFKIEQKDVSSRDETILTALDRIAWHQINNKWDHSIEYYIGDGSEILNL